MGYVEISQEKMSKGLILVLKIGLTSNLSGRRVFRHLGFHIAKCSRLRGRIESQNRRKWLKASA